MAVRADKHQRILLDLLTKPGNDVCADCKARAPRWSSWNIGIFLCVHCASIHRKIGTHVSKVKSVTLDTWTKEQVESVREMGNLKANALYIHDERRNPPPTDSDESDRGSEMEIYIRNKYQHKRFMAPKPREIPAHIPMPTAKASVSDDLQMPGIIEMRAPSRAKSTPITSSSSGAHSTNVLSGYREDPKPMEPKVPVFSSGLPFRPATAAGLDHPSLSSSSRAYETPYTAAQPVASSSSSPYTNTNTNPVPTSHNPYPMAPRMQPSSGSNPLWDDMMSLTLQSSSPAQAPFNTTQAGNVGGLYGGAVNVPSTSAFAQPASMAPRSFSLPLTSMTTGVAPNPFSQIGMAGGSYGQQQPNAPNPFNTMPASMSMGNNFQQQYNGGSQPQQQQFGGMAPTTMSPTTPQSTSSSSLSASFQQTYRLTPSPSPFSPQQQPAQAPQLFQQTSTPFQSSPSTFQQQQQPSMSMGIGSFQQSAPFQSQQQQQQQVYTPSQQGQSAFAQSMLPAHLKNPNTGQTQGGTNPFGNTWGQQQQQQGQNGYGYGGGGAWGGR